MGALIVVIVSGILTCLDIISVNVFMTIGISSIAWMFIGAALYLNFGLLKFFYHDFLHWHRPDKSSLWSDELNTHAICKYCGEKIMEDSQGNWFTYGED